MKECDGHQQMKLIYCVHMLWALQILYNEFVTEVTFIKLFVLVLHMIPNLEVAAFVQLVLHLPSSKPAIF